PYWVSYVEQIAIAGGVPKIIETTEENEFKASVYDFDLALTKKTKAIIINSPNNPTGSVYSESELSQIADFAVKNNLYVISDEVYEHFIYGDEKQVSIASFNEEIKKRTIIVGAGSKTYSMPGWRLGFLASEPKLAKAFGNIASHLTGCLSSITDAAGVAAFDGELDSVVAMKEEFASRREFLLNRIEEIEGVSCKPPKGAFYAFINIEHFIKNGAFETSSEFCDALLDEGEIALTPGDAFGQDGFIRFS
ncbi:aminotransferase class I/II-fold pyridoxal phosphate-dependent enzyme, partial [Treponema sp. R6D11]